MTIAPSTHGSLKIAFKTRYGNFIGGKWVAPVKGEYFENITPVTGQPICEIPRSTADDIELALDAAHAAKTAWGKTSGAERAIILNKINQTVLASDFNVFYNAATNGILTITR